MTNPRKGQWKQEKFCFPNSFPRGYTSFYFCKSSWRPCPTMSISTFGIFSCLSILWRSMASFIILYYLSIFNMKPLFMCLLATCISSSLKYLNDLGHFFLTWLESDLCVILFVTNIFHFVICLICLVSKWLIYNLKHICLHLSTFPAGNPQTPST